MSDINHYDPGVRRKQGASQTLGASARCTAANGRAVMTLVERWFSL
jgi:hypothetical protein